MTQIWTLKNMYKERNEKKKKEKWETQFSKAKRLKVKYLAHSFHKSNFK